MLDFTVPSMRPNVTLNAQKCILQQPSVKFWGHLIDHQGVRADLDETTVVQDMPTPKSLTDLRRFMGMVNQLGKFSPRIAELSEHASVQRTVGHGAPCSCSRSGLCGGEKGTGTTLSSGLV